MITLASVAISLTVGLVILVGVAYGLEDNNDTFNIDVRLSKYKPAIETNKDWYKLPNNYQLVFSNSSLVCPSNDCKGTSIPDNRIAVIIDDNSMFLSGDFKLVDDKSNGHLIPKKQKLIEEMNLDFFCKYQDIQEDAANKTTKYIYSDPQRGSIKRNYNETTYPYTFTATFELPSRHLVLNATEEHHNPYLLFSGNLVFRNEDGKIEVR